MESSLQTKLYYTVSSSDFAFMEGLQIVFADGRGYNYLKYKSKTLTECLTIKTNIRQTVTGERHQPARNNYSSREVTLKGLNDLYQAALVEM